MGKKLKVLALFDAIGPTTLDQDLSTELKTADWKTEAAVLSALEELGYPHEQLAIFDDLDLLRQKLQTFTPDVIFNLADQFRNNRAFDQHIVSYLAMHDIPFTGCGSTGLTPCKPKAISKKIPSHHRHQTPPFVTHPPGPPPPWHTPPPLPPQPPPLLRMPCSFPKVTSTTCPTPPLG